MKVLDHVHDNKPVAGKPGGASKASVAATGEEFIAALCTPDETWIVADQLTIAELHAPPCPTNEQTNKHLDELSRQSLRPLIDLDDVVFDADGNVDVNASDRKAVSDANPNMAWQAQLSNPLVASELLREPDSFIKALGSLLIAVDFDDTISQNNCYPKCGPPVPGALNGLRKLVAAGHRIQIWTCRHGQALELAQQWLQEYEVDHERINENCPLLIEQWGETRKMAADLYIDDKNLRGLPHWDLIPHMVDRHVRMRLKKEKTRQRETIPRLIGLSGKRGSGKNTVADLLQQLMPDWWTERGFADKLKYLASQLTGGAYDMYSQAGKQAFIPAWGMSAGELLQRLGTNAIRDGLHPDAWLLACFASIEQDEHTIITDCRFPNEADAIRARGGVLIRLEGDPLAQRGDGSRDDNHPSETALDDYPHFALTISNTGSLEELRKAVDQALKLISIKH